MGGAALHRVLELVELALADQVRHRRRVDQHLDRLYWGADKIGLDIGLTREALTAEIWRLLDANLRKQVGPVIEVVLRGTNQRGNDNINATSTIMVASREHGPVKLPEPPAPEPKPPRIANWPGCANTCSRPASSPPLVRSASAATSPATEGSHPKKNSTRSSRP